MKILHVMPEIPCPPDSGVRADIWDRLQAMSHLGHSIDALVMKTNPPPEEHSIAELRSLVNSVQFVERRPMRQCLATLTPTSVACNRPLAEMQLDGQYDITLAEGDSTLPIFDNPGLKTRVRALRVHNNETVRAWATARTEESFFRSQLCRFEALRFLFFSRFAYRNLDSLWFISQSECKNFGSTHSEASANSVWLPPSLLFGNEPKRSSQHSKRVLFVASFHIALNREALRWYLKEVHAHLSQDPEYELVVAGSTNGRRCAYQFTEEIKREGRCRVHVNVDNLSPLYDECAVFVNPMRMGAGVKLKNVHAIERHIPVVTTSIGNEGSGFLDREHVRVADTSSDFIAAIRELLRDCRSREQMAARAHDYLEKHYDCHANIHRLLTSLASVNALRSSEREASSSVKGACGMARR